MYRVMYLAESFFVMAEEMPPIKMWLAKERIPVPGFKSADAAAMDLACAESVKVPYDGTWAIVHTYVHMAIPRGWRGIISARSSAARAGFEVHPGVIDADYRGEVMLLVRWSNGDKNSKEHYNVGSGTLAQIRFERSPQPEVTVVANLEDLGETERGAGGFGSTGRTAVAAVNGDDDEPKPKKRSIRND